jgi:hypothetical protein
MFAKVHFDFWPSSAGTEGRQVAEGIDREQLIHAAHVDGQAWGMLSEWVDMSHNACPSTIGDHTRTYLLSSYQEVSNIFLFLGESHRIRKPLDSTAAE